MLHRMKIELLVSWAWRFSIS